MSRLECPTHVIVSADSAARGTANAGRARRNTDGSGSFGRGRVLRCTSIHLSKLPKPGTASATQGFRKPPPGRWCAGALGRVTGRNLPARGRVAQWGGAGPAELSATTWIVSVSANAPLVATMRPVPTDFDVTRATCVGSAYVARPRMVVVRFRQ